MKKFVSFKVSNEFIVAYYVKRAIEHYADEFIPSYHRHPISKLLQLSDEEHFKSFNVWCESRYDGNETVVINPELMEEYTKSYIDALSFQDDELIDYKLEMMDCGVFDKRTKKLYPCEFGEHYSAIRKALCAWLYNEYDVSLKYTQKIYHELGDIPKSCYSVCEDYISKHLVIKGGFNPENSYNTLC